MMHKLNIVTIIVFKEKYGTKEIGTLPLTDPNANTIKFLVKLQKPPTAKESFLHNKIPLRSTTMSQDRHYNKQVVQMAKIMQQRHVYNIY